MKMNAALSFTRMLRMTLVPGLELVPDAVHRDDVARSLGIGFHLAAQVLDMRVHGAFVAFEGMSLHAIDQLHPREDLVGTAGHDLEQPELGRGQFDAPASEADLVGPEIDDKIASPDHLDGLPGAPPEHRPHAR